MRWQELTDSATLIMLDRSLLPRGWPCAALIWLEKGERLDVISGRDTKLEEMGKGGGHRTHLASSIAAASSRGPFRASQVAFAFSSKCFRLKEKKKMTVKNNKKKLTLF